MAEEEVGLCPEMGPVKTGSEMKRWNQNNTKRNGHKLH